VGAPEGLEGHEGVEVALNLVGCRVPPGVDFRRRHAEVSRPGELLNQEKFYWSTLKGVGKVYGIPGLRGPLLLSLKAFETLPSSSAGCSSDNLLRVLGMRWSFGVPGFGCLSNTKVPRWTGRPP
jgi:hypothetical protein